jgi:pheromone shutdown protein TraB
LELCTSRFADLKRELIKNEQEERPKKEKPWIFAFWEMVSKTIYQRGIPTGLAAAVLGGFSGIQTALSGFTPGLEFTTALQRSERFKCDIVLADQDVDETLLRVGSLPFIALENALSNDRMKRWSLYQDTLVRAVAGKYDEKDIPQLQLPMVLLRSPAAIQDLVRLTIPPTLFFWVMIYGMAAVAGVDVFQPTMDVYTETATLTEKVPHWLASGGILFLGYLGLTLPAVGVILTERDEILTTGIQAACQRAGKGGRVVAVLGLLHVNGVAKRMLSQPVSVADKVEL